MVAMQRKETTMKTFNLLDLGRASKVTAALLMGAVPERDSAVLRNYI